MVPFVYRGQHKIVAAFAQVFLRAAANSEGSIIDEKTTDKANISDGSDDITDYRRSGACNR